MLKPSLKSFVLKKDCPVFTKFLFFNFVLRLNFYVLSQFSFDFPSFKKNKLAQKLKAIMSHFIGLLFPTILLIFIYVSLIQQFVDFYAILALNGMILLLLLVIFAQRKSSSSRIYQMKTIRYFRIFMLIHFGINVFIYINDLIIFHKAGKSDEYQFRKSIQTNLNFRTLKRNGVSGVREWWNDGDVLSKKTMAYESIKTMIILITSILLRHWTKFKSKEEKNIKISRTKLVSATYILFFVFFVINIAYFMSNQYSFYLINKIPLFLIFLLILILNVLIRRFYKIGNLFKFSQIVKQEIKIFKNIFTKNLKEVYFKNIEKNTISQKSIDGDFLFEKYLILKDDYRKSFFQYLRIKLLQKFHFYFRVYFVFFCLYFVLQVNCICAFGLDVLEKRMLSIEMLIFILSIFLIQMMTMAQNEKNLKKGKAEFEPKLEHINLLLRCNELFISIIKAKSTNNYEKEILEINTLLEDFLSYKFDLVLKTYRPDIYNKLKENKIVLNMESKIYKLEHSNLFINKDLLGQSAFRGLIELKLLQKKEERVEQTDFIEELRAKSTGKTFKNPSENEYQNQSMDMDLKSLKEKFSQFSKNRSSRTIEKIGIYEHFNICTPKLRFQKHPFRDDEIEHENSLTLTEQKSINQNAELEKIENQMHIDSQKQFEEIEQNIFLCELRMIINQSPLELYQSVKLGMKSLSFTRLKLNVSLQKKLRFLPQTKFLSLLAIFYFSLFDILKDSILNLLLLSIATNVNVLTLFTIVFVLGFPIFSRIKYTWILTIVSFSFWIRISFHMYPEILKDFKYSYLFHLINFSNFGFILEMIIICSNLFLFIPTFLLVDVVFEKFIRIKNDLIDEENIEKTSFANKESILQKNSKRNKKTSFLVEKSPTSQTFTVNFFEWNKLQYRILPFFHEICSINNKFIYPLIYGVLVFSDVKYAYYFEVYLLFQISKHLLSKMKGQKAKWFSSFFITSFTGLNIIMFFSFFFTIVISVINQSETHQMYLIVAFVVIKFKIILNSSDFFRYDLKVVHKNEKVKRELSNFLENLSLNDSLIIRKTISEINYQKFITFEKFSENSKNLSPVKLMQSNLLHFNYIFSKGIYWKIKLIEKLTLRMFENVQKFSNENIFFLILVLQEKYKDLVDFDFDYLEILCGNFDSIVGFIVKVEKCRLDLISRKFDISDRFHKIVDEEVKNFVKNPNSHSLFQKTHKNKNESWDGSDFFMFNRLNPGNISVLGQEFLGYPKNYGFSDQIHDLNSLLDRVKAYFKDSEIFIASKENFFPTSFEFWISDKSFVKINNYKYACLLDNNSNINLSVVSLIIVFWMLFLTFLDQILIILLTFFIILSYGYISFIFIFFIIFFVSIEKLPNYRYSRLYIINCLLLSSMIIRHQIFEQTFTNKYIILIFGSFINLRFDVAILTISTLLMTITKNRINKNYFIYREFIGESCYRVF